MTIAVVGGGSGGHITPNLVIAQALKSHNSAIRIVYISNRGERLNPMISSNEAVDKLYSIYAGKFRRYQGSVLQSFNIRTFLYNLRDIFRLGIGTLEAIRVLGKEKPAVIFIKGGFVGVPAGLAAAIYRIPFITHDTDSTPGLANRLIGRWAAIHAVANPAAAEYYHDKRSIVTGPIIAPEYKLVTNQQQKKYKRDLFGDESVKVVLVTGGGQGAERINKAVQKVAADLLNKPNLILVHQTGKGKGLDNQVYYSSITENKRKRIYRMDFIPNLYAYSAAADVIVTRAGATSLAEFSSQAKACVVIPNPALRWDILNARELIRLRAIVTVEEAAIDKDPSVLTNAVVRLLENEGLRKALGEAINSTLVSGADEKITQLLLKTKQS